MIMRMRNEHAEAVGYLHHLYIDCLLQKLGRGACTAFYETEIESQNNFGFVYVENSTVLGFTFGTLDNSKLFKKNKMLLVICLSFLKKPWLVPKIFFHLASKFPPSAEALYSATDLKIRGKGIGKKLLLQRHEEFKRLEVKRYETRIDSDNVVNLKLQQKYFDAKILDEYLENRKKRFRLEITA